MYIYMFYTATPKRLSKPHVSTSQNTGKTSSQEKQIPWRVFRIETTRGDKREGTKNQEEHNWNYKALTTIKLIKEKRRCYKTKLEKG